MPITGLSSTKGVKYIKISRIDTDGRDNTLSLQELNNIRIKFTDVGIVNYPVISIFEYPSYYLYQVQTTDITSSADNTVLDYRMLATTGSQISYSISLGFSPYYVSVEVNDARGWYNTTSSAYIFGNTPSIPLTFSFGTTASGWTGILEPSFRLSSSINGIIASCGPGAGGSSTMSYAGFFQTGETITIKYGSLSQFSTANSYFSLTQTAATSSSTNLVVLEPYLEGNFEQSDCNTLLNNVFEVMFDPFYMDVDYSSNALRPSNFNQIISGSAIRARVKPYYYSLLRHITPRYNGSRVSSAFPNLYISGPASIHYLNGDIGAYSGDISYGKTPNIELVDSTIFEFKWGGSTYPEIEQAGAFKMGNILDVNYVPSSIGKLSKDSNDKPVNIISPLQEDAYEFTIDSRFPPNFTPNLIQYNGINNINPSIKVVTTEFGVPGISNYIIPTNFGSNNLAAQNFFNITSIIFNSGAYEVIKDNNDHYITSTFVIGSTLVSNISTSLAQGNRWFATIYYSLPSPVTGTLLPYNNGFSGSNYLGEFYSPLENKGVYEVGAVSSSIGLSFKTGINYNSGSILTFGSGAFGMLLWKANIPNKQGKFIIVDGDTLSGAGKGALLTKFVKSEIIQDFNYITTNFGINPGNIGSR